MVDVLCNYSYIIYLLKWVFGGLFCWAKGLSKVIQHLLTFFVLTMEALSTKLDTIMHSPQFRFHPKCSDLRINHVMFTDDLCVQLLENL